MPKILSSTSDQAADEIGEDDYPGNGKVRQGGVFLKTIDDLHNEACILFFRRFKGSKSANKNSSQRYIDSYLYQDREKNIDPGPCLFHLCESHGDQCDLPD